MCLIMVATIGPPSSKGNVVIVNLLDAESLGKNVGGVKPNPAAKDAGLKPGDAILKINHIKIKDPGQVVRIVKENSLRSVLFKVQRTKIVNSKKKHEILYINVVPNEDGKIGVGLGLASDGEYEKPSHNPFIWLIQAAQILWEWTLSMLIGLWYMFMNLFGMSKGGIPKVGAEDLHGIIAIVSIFAQALTIDFREIYRWSALISVNLAIINLLPIPALDGGHLLFMFIEKIRGKKLAESIQQRAIQTGFFLLILLMVFVLFNDIRGLISGKFDMLKEDQTSDKKN